MASSSAPAKADGSLHLSDRLSAAGLFAENYAQARERFRALAQALGWEIESHALAARGPAGEELTIDVATHRPADPRRNGRCLIVSSGLHGVEAFLGSALQCATMQHWIDRPATAPATRCVFLHALNPYGFAWLRRTDEANIDLNRNFLLDSEPYRGSPRGYADLDRFLNPKCPPQRWDMFALQAAARILQVGLPALKATIAGGQFEFPQGLFYGGAQASQTKRIVAESLSRWLGDSHRVTHIDLHSGLGKWGSYKLLVDYDLTIAQREQLAAWFGAAALEENPAHANDPGVAYATRGGFGQWCMATQSERDYLFAYAEFGVYNILRTIAGLRAENQAHFWANANDARTQCAKLRLKELLCPASPSWRENAVQQGVELIARAADGSARIST